MKTVNIEVIRKALDVNECLNITQKYTALDIRIFSRKKHDGEFHMSLPYQGGMWYELSDDDPLAGMWGGIFTARQMVGDDQYKKLTLKQFLGLMDYKQKDPVDMDGILKKLVDAMPKPKVKPVLFYVNPKFIDEGPAACYSEDKEGYWLINERMMNGTVKSCMKYNPKLQQISQDVAEQIVQLINK